MTLPPKGIAPLAFRFALVLFAGVLFFLTPLSVFAADVTAHQEITSWISETKLSTGFLPGYSQMAEKIELAGSALSPREETALWREWGAAQQPSFSKEELIEISKAKRASIDTVRLKYSVTWTKADEAGVLQPDSFNTESFLAKHDRLRVDRQGGTTPQDLGNPTVMAYDGAVVRKLRGSDEEGFQGAVQAFDHRYGFFDAASPLGQQMLLDAELDQADRTLRYNDMITFLESPGKYGTVILEAPELVDGRRALVCVDGGAPNMVVWLDPERGFAVLKMQTNTIEWVQEEEDGEYFAASCRPNTITEAHDFIDCGNGLWMPQKIVRTRSSKDDPADFLDLIVTDIELVEMNEPVDDSEFQGIFAAGTQIFDSITGEIYSAGSVEAVEDNLLRVMEQLKQDLPRPDTELPAQPAPSDEPEAPLADAQPVEAESTPSVDAPPFNWALAVLITAVLVLLIAFIFARRKRRK